MNILNIFQTLVALLGGLFGQSQPKKVQVFEVWHAPKGGVLKRYSEAPTKPQAEKVVASLKTIGGMAEVRGPIEKVVAANKPAAEPTWDDFKRLLKSHEGNIPHMYLDTVGAVTVGVGNMMPTAAQAQALGFVNRSTGKAATADEIKTDFDEVTKQTKGKIASKYKVNTKLDLPDAAINALLDTRIAGFKSELKAEFPDFDQYPVRVQYALLDMAFNLGTQGVIKKFPSFTAGIKANNAEGWLKAAKESNRPQVSAERNTSVKQWLEDAAAAAKAKEAAK